MGGLAYCIRCKGKKEVVNGKLEYYTNGTPVEKGNCKDCGCKVTRIMSKEERTRLVEAQKQFGTQPNKETNEQT